VRVAVVHGYFLHDSGSGVYVRELTRALVRLGHDVTLVCQEPQPERCDFVDSAYALGAENESLILLRRTPRRMPGSCRMVRPDLRGELLVYVEGFFPSFERGNVRAFQSAPADMRERYISRNVHALRTVFDEWAPELVIAQHVIMQPYVVSKALAGRAPYIVTEHGSALNFSVRANEDLVPFALEGLAGAARIATVSEGARDDLVGWALEHDLPIGAKTVAMPPGIDAGLFTPAGDREAALTVLRQRVSIPAGLALAAADDIVVYAGSLRPTKGVQHAVAAMPLVSRSRPRPVRLLIAGGGPARAPLDRLATLVGCGDAGAARRLVDSEPLLQSPPEWGEVVGEAPVASGDTSAVFLGHLEHDQLAAVFAAADVCVVPSVFPEAAALVNAEGLAAGAVPLASYHSGMTALDDLLSQALDDPTFAGLVPGPDLTGRLAALVAHVLDTYPTKDAAFRRGMHELALNWYPSWEKTAESYAAMVR
jgi:glycosyltransferase involved in cell wall biosynthesis